MLIDQTQYSPVQKYHQESAAQNANLDSLIGGSIRILNQGGYSKQNYKNLTRNKPVKPSFKTSNAQLTKTTNYQNSVSMKNINEIPIKNEYSSNHYNNLQLALKAATAALQKSKITASTNFIPSTQNFVGQTQKISLNKIQKSSKSPSNTSSTSSTSSTQVLSGSAASILFTSNQSLFQPYAKIKDRKSKQNEILQTTSSTPIYPKSKLYRNTLVIDTIPSEHVNNSFILNTNTIQSNSTSSDVSSSPASNNKLDTSDYDNIENESSKMKKISIQINPLRRQKSASTEFLNTSEKTSNDIDEDSLNNYNHLKSEFDNVFNNLDKEISNFQSSSPQPPKIQPYSGVLSKSLFSLVLRPQPVKPVNDTTSKIEEPKMENTNSSKSVTTLNSKNDFDSSDNSINIDDVECDNDSNSPDTDLIVDDMSEKDRRIKSLEADLKSKDEIIIELKNRLNIEMEKNKYNQRKISKECLDDDKLAYEHKINELKTHFNKQLSIFEENERFQMQNKLNNLQKIYNDLKINYKKNLEAELKQLRTKLGESESNAEQLYKQLQSLQTRKMVNTVSCQTSSVNERDLNNNTELLFYLRKLKSENNDLKLQLESERRRFQSDKEKWFIHLQTYKRNSMSSNENLTQTKTILNKQNNKNIVTSQSGNMLNFMNNSTHSSNTSDQSSNSSGKTKSTTVQKQPFVKNLLLNHQHYL